MTDHDDEPVRELVSTISRNTVEIVGDCEGSPNCAVELRIAPIEDRFNWTDAHLTRGQASKVRDAITRALGYDERNRLVDQRDGRLLVADTPAGARPVDLEHERGAEQAAIRMVAAVMATGATLPETLAYAALSAYRTYGVQAGGPDRG